MKPLVPDTVGPFTTLQQVFNRAWRWSRTHGKCNSDTLCLYRTPDGRNACLIGACIPDSMYDRLKETEGDVGTLFANDPWLSDDLFPDLNFNDLCQLQGCHDGAKMGSEYLDSVTRRLKAFAASHCLDVPTT